MRKFVVALFIVTLLAGLASASETPQCRLGTAWAVDPAGYKPAPGEWNFSAPKGALVVMEHREAPSSSKIREVLCTLPEDVKSWAPAPGTPGNPHAEICANGFVPQGWSIPLPPNFLASLRGERGKQGPPGSKGPKGDPGEDLKSSLPLTQPASGWNCGTGCKVLVGLGIAGGVYLVAKALDKGDKDTAPRRGTGDTLSIPTQPPTMVAVAFKF